MLVPECLWKYIYCIQYYGGRCAKRSEGMLLVETLGCLPRALWTVEGGLGSWFYWTASLVARVEERWDQRTVRPSLHVAKPEYGSREMSVRNREGHVCPIWGSPLAWPRRCLQWAFVECLELVNGWIEGWIQTCRKQWRKRGRILSTFQFMVPVPSCLLAPGALCSSPRCPKNLMCVTRAIPCWCLLLANCNQS